MTNGVADSGAGQFATSAHGTLVYATGGTRPDDQREFVWVSHEGMVEPIPAPKQEYVAARLSPDDRRIVAFAAPSRVVTYDVARGTVAPLTTQQERAAWGVFSPDATRVVFQSVLAGRSLLTWKAADGTGTSEHLDPTAQTVQTPGSWSTDDKIAFAQIGETTRNDIWVFDVRTRKPSPVVQTSANETHPALSSDGKWLAYVSDVSGRDEVYIQPYPGPGPRVGISTGVGLAPAWRADGRELFYLTPIDGAPGLRMMAVALTPTSSALTPGVPRKLFEGRYGSTSPARGYDVTSDGRRFLMIRNVDPPPRPPSQLILVTNFGEELTRRFPPSQK